jgi:hypothetical protein
MANRKIVGIPSVPKPIGTSGKLWSQTIDGIELKVFEGTLEYAKRIAGVEGEYEYWRKPSTDPKYKDSLVLVDPGASWGGGKASILKARPAGNPTSGPSPDILPLLGKAIEVLEKIEANTRKVEDIFG